MREVSKDEMPEGWIECSLADVCNRIVDGSHNPPKGASEGKPMLSARNIQKRQILFDDYRLISEAAFVTENQRTMVAPLDVLLTIVGTIGRTAVVQFDTPAFTLQRSVAVLKPTDAIVSDYLAFALEAPVIQKHFVDNAKGTAQKGIYLKALSEVRLPLAPLAEQKRIADKLEAALGRVDACRTRLDRVPDLLKRFRQSVLAAATSGRLTEDWREKKVDRLTVPLRNAIKTIRTGPFGSSLHKADYVSGGTPIVNPMHINGGRISPTFGMTVDDDTLKRLSDFKLSVGDVIIGRRGEMGRCAVVTEAENGWLCGTGSMVLTPHAALDAEYLQIFLSSPSTVQALEGESVGSTMVNLNQKILLDLNIFFPSLPAQQEIVRRVEALFALADQIETRLTQTRARVERLTPSTLAKAFRGDLVPQDPKDEPASVLLSRLKSEETGTTPKHREKKPANALRIRVSKKHAVMTKSRFDDDVKGQPYLASLLRASKGQVTANELFKEAHLSIVDFYKQLSWEVEQGYVWHDDKVLEAKS